MRSDPPQQPIQFSSPVFGSASAASTYGSFIPSTRPGNVVANHDNKNSRREAELAQRERETAKKEMNHQQVNLRHPRTRPHLSPPIGARTHPGGASWP